MVSKIILYIATTLDGFIASKNGSVKWLDKYNESGEDYGYKKFLDSVDTIVIGKTTYEQVLSFGEYPYKELKTYVFAKHVSDDENVTFVQGHVKEFVDNLDAGKEQNIWLMGGANIINQFLKEHLIDEFIIFVMPTILGSGTRLFEDDNYEKSLVFTSSKSYDSGVVELRYEKIN